MLGSLSRYWWLVMLRGVFAVIFGLLAIFMPAITLAVLILFFGAYVLVDGVSNVIYARSERDQNEHWWLGFLEGLVSIVAGILVFAMPGLTGIVLLYLIAFWAILTGIVEIGSAIQLRKEIDNEVLLGLSGLLSIAFGVLLVVFPAGGAVAVAWIIGFYAISFGVTMIAFGWKLRSSTNDLPFNQPQLS